MDRRVEKIKALLKAGSYEMNDSWLKDCIHYYLTEYKRNASDDEAMNFAMTQWSLSDLREICSTKGCLPKNLSEQKCITLPGKYILQVDKGYDISTSKYKQLEKLRDVSVENIEATEVDKSVSWEPKSNRMMQLFLTDGVQDVIAIEHKPIRSLKDNFLAGYKVMIKGPVTCRRGIILLEEKNYVCVGGEVTSLFVKNHPENVFARALKLPENPNPDNDKDDDDDDEQSNGQAEVDEMFNEDFDIDMEALTELEKRPSVTLNNQRNDDKSKETKMAKKNSSLIQGTKMMTQPGGRRSEALGSLPVCFEATVENEDIDFPDGDDDDFMEIAEATNGVDLNDDFNQTNQGSNSRSNGMKNQVDSSWDAFTSEAMMDDDDFDDLLAQDEIEKTLGQFSQVTKNCSSNSTMESKKIAKPDYSTSLSDNKTLTAVNNSTFQASASTNVSSTAVKEFKSPLPRAPASAPKQPVSKETPKARINNKATMNNTKITDFIKKPEPIPKSFEFIDEIKKTKWTSDIVIKRVRGKIRKLSQLGKNDLKWFVDVKIKDGTGNLDVVIESELLTSIIGYSVAQFKIMKKNKTDPTATKKLQEGLQRCEKMLSTLDAFLDIEFSPSSKPVVVKITELTDTDRDNFDKLFRQHGYT